MEKFPVTWLQTSKYLIGIDQKRVMLADDWQDWRKLAARYPVGGGIGMIGKAALFAQAGDELAPDDDNPSWRRIMRAQTSLTQALGRYNAQRDLGHEAAAQAMLFTAIVASKSLTGALKAFEVSERSKQAIGSDVNDAQTIGDRHHAS